MARALAFAFGPAGHHRRITIRRNGTTRSFPWLLTIDRGPTRRVVVLPYATFADACADARDLLAVWVHQ